MYSQAVRKPKNTESFEPDYSEPHLQVRIANGQRPKYPYIVRPYDVILVPGLFPGNQFPYSELLKEVPYSEFLSWHGDTHWIANDRAGWKDRAPLFNKIIDRLAQYFNMDVRATRFNLYESGKEWKPYHHDAAAIDTEKAKTQNITIGVSFGATRAISFQQNGTKTRVDFPLEHAMVYAFGNQVNSHWKHGVPPRAQTQVPSPGVESRISIIAWGFVHQEKN